MLPTKRSVICLKCKKLLHSCGDGASYEWVCILLGKQACLRSVESGEEARMFEISGEWKESKVCTGLNAMRNPFHH